MRPARPAVLAFTFAVAAAVLAFSGCETTLASRSATGARATAPPTAPRAHPPREAAYISLERTTNSAGAPAGPVYVVTLFEDGRVLFEGHASVKRKGTFSKSIPREKAAEIFATVETINLWQRERRYDIERAESGGNSIIVRTASAELPWDILRVRNHGRMMRIDGLFFAPQDILTLKQLIEDSVGLADWIGQPHEWQK